MRPLRVFLCHANEDKGRVRELYYRLLNDGFSPWFDVESLIPGQNWEMEIPKAVRDTDIVLVCLSNKSVTKAGYVQKEMKFALDEADQKPEGTIFLIPLKLEECIIPERLRHLHWLNYFESDGYGKLLRALQARAEELGLLDENVHIDIVLSPWADDAGGEIATKFSPDYYPQKLRKVRFFISRYGKPWTEFEVRLYAINGSIPGFRLDSGGIIGAGKMGSEWVEIDLSAYEIEEIEGEFFVSMYWLTAPKFQGRDAQCLAAKHTRDMLPGRTYLRWPKKDDWIPRDDRCSIIEVEFENGLILKSVS
mgnify:CR=1 FL=1